MTLELYDTSIVFKFFSDRVAIGKDTLPLLAGTLEDSPLAERFPAPTGVHLFGDRISRTVALGAISDLTEDETARVDRIEPLFQGRHRPFLLTRDRLEIDLPTAGLRFGPLMETVDHVVAHFGDLPGLQAGRRIEMPVSGALTERLLRQILLQVLPALPPGAYRYEVVVGTDRERGDLTTPTSAEGLPEEVRDLTIPLRTPFSVRFVCGADRLAIVRSRARRLDVTVSGSTTEWFQAVAGLLQAAGAFEAPDATVQKPPVLPRFGSR